MFADGGASRWHTRVLRRHLATWRVSASVLSCPWYAMCPGWRGILSKGFHGTARWVGRPRAPQVREALDPRQTGPAPPKLCTRGIRRKYFIPAMLSYRIGFSSDMNYLAVPTGLKYFWVQCAIHSAFWVGMKYFVFFFGNLATREIAPGYKIFLCFGISSPGPQNIFYTHPVRVAFCDQKGVKIVPKWTEIEI